MNLTITPAARSDLLDIAQQIARDNPERAELFVEELIGFSAALIERPQSYRLRKEWGDNVRSSRRGNYQVVFEANDYEVLILRYLHVRRNIDAILSQDQK